MNDNYASRRDLPQLEDRLAAERKLCWLFKSFGVDALAERDRLIDPYLERAADFFRPHVGMDFALLALEEAEADLEMWFRTVLGEHLGDDADAVMTGRAAFLMANESSRFAGRLLEPVETLSDDVISALVDHAPRAVPPSELGDMHHQPYEAWSPAGMMMSPLSAENGPLQWLAGLVRRDGKALGLSWRGTGTTS